MAATSSSSSSSSGDWGGSVLTSQGIRMLPRILKFYKELFESNEFEGSARVSGRVGSGIYGVADAKRPPNRLELALGRLGYDFLQLDLNCCHEEIFQRILLHYKDVSKGEKIIRLLLYHCLSGLSSPDKRIQRNALATLHNLLYVILHQAVPRARPMEALELVLYRGQGAAFVKNLLKGICAVLRGEDVEPATRSGALKVLMALSTASLNLHQNPLLELFYTEKVFNVLMLLLTTEARAKALLLSERVKILVILVPLVHFKRFEALNTGLEVLTKRLSTSQLLTFNSCLSSLLRLIEHLFADLPAYYTVTNDSKTKDNTHASSSSATAAGGTESGEKASEQQDSTSSTIASSLRSSLGAFAGLLSSLMEVDTPPPPSRRTRSGSGSGSGSGADTKDGKEAMLPHSHTSRSTNQGKRRLKRFSTERCFRKARHCLIDLSMFLLHTMLRDNKKYLIRIAKIARLPAAAQQTTAAVSKTTNGDRGEGGNATASTGTNADTQRGGDKDGKQPMVAPTRPAAIVEMFLSVCSVIFQQPLGPRTLLSTQLCLTVAHQMSQDTPANVVLFSLNGDPGTHLLEFRRNAKALEIDPTSASTYEIKTAPSRGGEWVRLEAKQPLAASLFRFVLGFVKRQLPKISKVRDEAASTIVVLLDILYRHFTYQLHADIEHAARVHMTAIYLDLGKLLINMIKHIGSMKRFSKPPEKRAATRGGPAGSGAATPLLQALYQSAHFLHLLLCVRGKIFHGEDVSKTAKGAQARLIYELTRNAPELARVRQRLKWAPIIQSELIAVASAAEAMEQLIDTRQAAVVQTPSSKIKNSASHSEEANIHESNDDEGEHDLEAQSQENQDSISQATSRWLDGRMGHGMSPAEVCGLVHSAEGDLHVTPLNPSRQVRETAVFDQKTDQRFFNQVVNYLIQDFAMLYLCGAAGTSAAMDEEEKHWEVASQPF